MRCVAVTWLSVAVHLSWCIVTDAMPTPLVDRLFHATFGTDALGYETGPISVDVLPLARPCLRNALAQVNGPGLEQLRGFLDVHEKCAQVSRQAAKDDRSTVFNSCLDLNAHLSEAQEKQLRALGELSKSCVYRAVVAVRENLS